jgi:hypothetical protein
MEEKIRQLRRTDLGNRIGYDWDNQDGPTWEDLFRSYFLNECSAEWLAEQLNIPLAEVKKVWLVWDEHFQERTPLTAKNLEKAMGHIEYLMKEDKVAFNKLLADIEIDL